MSTTDPILYTVPEAAEALRIGRSTLYELIAQGNVPTIRIGRSVRISRSALSLWVDQQS